MEPNILLIVCDTLRKDVLRVYGGRAKTPHLNKLAKDSMIYENAIAPCPWTFPSHVSLFTGLYLNEHKVYENGSLDISEEERLSGLTKRHKELKAQRIQGYLRGLGYNVGGISNNPHISSFTGFGEASDWFFYLDPIPKEITDTYAKAWKLGASILQVLGELIKRGRVSDIPKYARTRSGLVGFRHALNYPIDKGATITNNIIGNTNLGEKFFLFVNLMEVHNPYVNEKRADIENNFAGIKEISDRKVEILKNDYIEEIEYLDSKLGELIENLKTRGLYENTIIIITSDHGQAFNEHGFMYHGIYLYDELVRIPLIIKYPKNRKFKKRKGYQSLVNIGNLIVDILNGKDDKRLSTEKAFSESYGTDEVLLPSQKRMKGYMNNRYNKVRKSVYKDNYKITVNGADGTIEEFLNGEKKLNPLNPKNKKAVKMLLNELKRFADNEDFKIPKGR